MNNLRIPRTKNAKFSEFYYYLSTDIHKDFQICISVPLKLTESVTNLLLDKKVVPGQMMKSINKL